MIKVNGMKINKEENQKKVKAVYKKLDAKTRTVLDEIFKVDESFYLLDLTDIEDN
jgi:hypothetical protein